LEGGSPVSSSRLVGLPFIFASLISVVDLHSTKTMPSSINKKCINFDKLTNWHKSVSVDMKKWLKVMKKPNGVKQEPSEIWHSKEWFEKLHHYV